MAGIGLVVLGVLILLSDWLAPIPGHSYTALALAIISVGVLYLSVAGWVSRL